MNIFKIIFISLVFLNSLFATVTIEKDIKVMENFNIKYIYDETRKLSFHKIKQKKFTKIIDSQFTLGYKKGNFWFKIEIKNKSNKKDFVLYFTEPFFEKVDLFVLNDKGKWIKKTNGLFVPLHKRDIYDHNPAFYIDINPNKSKIIYIKTYSKFGTFGEFKIYEKKPFLEQYKSQYMFLYILYFGGIIIIIIFNLFLYIKLKDSIYIFYVGYTLFFLIFIFLFSGIDIYFGLAPWHYRLHSSAPLFALFLILFSGKFLEINKYNKTLQIVFNTIAITFILLSILNFIDIEPWYQVFSSISTVVLVILVSSSIYVWIKGHKTAKYYLLILSLYITTIALISSLANGWLPNNDINRYAFLFASYLEIIFFALMLANRFNKIQNEKILLQEKFLKKKNINQKLLKQEIMDKTQETIKANQKLEQALKDKELILKELFHRVKNNFQMIIGLLWIEAQKHKSQTSKNKFLGLISRINSMSVMHQLLYNSDAISKINSKQFIKSIVKESQKIYKKDDLFINYNIEQFNIDISSSISLGIIINELLNNTFKYNENPKSKIEISLSKKDNIIYLLVKDNGQGFDNKKEFEGLGLKLIEQFVNYLENSSYNFSFSNGTEFELKFEEKICL